MKELEYPFDSQYLLRKKRAIKKELLTAEGLVEKKVAVLGGSTTNEIVDMLELFLLNNGIKPSFYQSEYAQYWQDGMFGNEALDAFNPDIIYIHTSTRNISQWPDVLSSKDASDELLQNQFEHFEKLWECLKQKYSCPIIQNNFEYPSFRLLGNMDAVSFKGRVNFVNRLNLLFAEYIDANDGIYLNDINYQSSCYGLDKWAEQAAWNLYKYALCIDAIPTLACNVANIIKSIYGKNKKALAIDLDNTLWGGVIGDDGVEGIAVGMETAEGEGYLEFQKYLKELSKQGVLLNIISKNDYENAIAGLKHPSMVLKEEDFTSIKANWEPKSANLAMLANELNLLPESFVFVDDNPAEREIISQQVKGVGIPKLERLEEYIKAVDKSGFFEMVGVSEDDLSRNKMYKENAKRSQSEAFFEDYGEYLKSLSMSAEIKPFNTVYLQRIAQLTNKSNQFNLTTLRLTEEEITAMMNSNEYITLYGKLTDCFGDNGVVALTIGKINTDKELDIKLWLMSCRVLKRDMEYAMLDELVKLCKEQGLKGINGYYYPTAKNSMVKNLFDLFGFTKLAEDENGNISWHLQLDGYENKNNYIKVN